MIGPLKVVVVHSSILFGYFIILVSVFSAKPLIFLVLIIFHTAVIPETYQHHLTGCPI